MDKEFLIYRFGFVAVKNGFVSPEQVSDALEIQFKENLKTEKHRRIGEILVEMGYMSPSQVKEVLAKISNRTPENA